MESMDIRISNHIREEKQMSVEYCHDCSKNIDTDVNVDHDVDCPHSKIPKIAYGFNLPLPTEDFCLSDEIKETRGAKDGSMDYFDSLRVEDVRKFIKLLIKNDYINTNGQMIKELTKLAGEKLI